MIDESALLRRRLAGAEERAAAAEAAARSAKAQLARTVLDAARTQETKERDQYSSTAEYHADMHALIEELAATKLALADIEKNVEVSRAQLENDVKSAHAQELEDLAKLHNAALNAQNDQSNHRLASAVDDKVSEARMQWKDELALQLRQAEDRAEKTLQQREQEWQAEFDRMATAAEGRDIPGASEPQISDASRSKKTDTKTPRKSRMLRVLLSIALMTAVLSLSNELFPDAAPTILQAVDRWAISTTSPVRNTVSVPGEKPENTHEALIGTDKSHPVAVRTQESLEKELQQRIDAFKAGAAADAARERRSIVQRISEMRSGLTAAEIRAATAEASLTEAHAKHVQKTTQMRKIKAKSDKTWRSTVARLQEQIKKLRAELASSKTAPVTAVDRAPPGSGFGATE